MRVQIFSLCLVAVCLTGCGRSKPRAEGVKGTQVVVGKLLIQTPTGSRVKQSDAAEKVLEDQMLILRGLPLRTTAEGTLRKEHADWKPAEVKLDVARVRGSSVISLVGRGGATNCARGLIDQMMATYLASVGSAKIHESSLKSETARIEKELQEAEHAWNSFKLDNDMVHASSTLASLQNRLQKLTVAQGFYKQEMDSSSRLSLEQDIERRKTATALPPDMPAEFAVLARVSPTATELSYLTALRQTNPVATEAARKEAAKERDARQDSHRRQSEVLAELLGEVQKDIDKLGALQQQAQKIEQTYKTAETAYKRAKETEMKDGIAAYSSITPNVVASVVEKASLATEGN